MSARNVLIHGLDLAHLSVVALAPQSVDLVPRSANLVRRNVVPGHLLSIARSPQRLVVVMVAVTVRLTKIAATAQPMAMEITAL